MDIIAVMIILACLAYVLGLLTGVRCRREREDFLELQCKLMEAEVDCVRQTAKYDDDADWWKYN